MRSFQSAFPRDFLAAYQAGVLQYKYRGVPCLKSPIDLGIYLKAIWDIKPKAFIEIGSKRGGSALWFADMLAVYGLDCPVISIDLKPPEDVHHERVTFLQGDAHDLVSVFEAHGLAELAHPWIISEDSAHTFQCCTAILNYLSQVMASGDLLVMEDGNLDELGLSDRYDGGPNRAITEFMAENPGVFELETSLCDMFGANATFAPNGYLKKT